MQWKEMRHSEDHSDGTALLPTRVELGGTQQGRHDVGVLGAFVHSAQPGVADQPCVKHHQQRRQNKCAQWLTALEQVQRICDTRFPMRNRIGLADP
jgi:hypothetical protein